MYIFAPRNEKRYAVKHKICNEVMLIHAYTCAPVGLQKGA